MGVRHSDLDMFHTQGALKHTCNLLAVLGSDLAESKRNQDVSEEKRRFPFPEIVSSGRLEVQKWCLLACPIRMLIAKYCLLQFYMCSVCILRYKRWRIRHQMNSGKLLIRGSRILCICKGNSWKMRKLDQSLGEGSSYALLKLFRDFLALQCRQLYVVTFSTKLSLYFLHLLHMLFVHFRFLRCSYWLILDYIWFSYLWLILGI